MKALRHLVLAALLVAGGVGAYAWYRQDDAQTQDVGPTGEVTGRVPVTADVDGPDYSQVTFLVSVDGGDYQPLGTDDNAPYRVYHDVSDLPVGASLVYKAIVSDLAGGLASDTTTATVGEEVTPPSPSGDARYAIVHYQRSDGDYGDHTTGDFNDFWGLHLWGDAIDPSESTSWDAPKMPDGIDDYGAFWEVQIVDALQPVNFIIQNYILEIAPRDRQATYVGTANTLATIVLIASTVVGSLGAFFHVVRGTLDCLGVDGRKRGRSKYGVKQARG